MGFESIRLHHLEISRPAAEARIPDFFFGEPQHLIRRRPDVNCPRAIVELVKRTARRSTAWRSTKC
jgi:hypothetical protein